MCAQCRAGKSCRWRRRSPRGDWLCSICSECAGLASLPPCLLAGTPSRSPRHATAWACAGCKARRHRLNEIRATLRQLAATHPPASGATSGGALALQGQAPAPAPAPEPGQPLLSPLSLPQLQLAALLALRQPQAAAPAASECSSCPALSEQAAAAAAAAAAADALPPPAALAGSCLSGTDSCDEGAGEDEVVSSPPPPGCLGAQPASGCTGLWRLLPLAALPTSPAPQLLPAPMLLQQQQQLHHHQLQPMAWAPVLLSAPDLQQGPWQLLQQHQLPVPAWSMLPMTAPGPWARVVSMAPAPTAAAAPPPTLPAQPEASPAACAPPLPTSALEAGDGEHLDWSSLLSDLCC